MKTITFYSYKGGVGRSLVLANLAQRLVEFGKSVCMLDFDLEAPGLPFKFDADKILAMNKKGVVDFVTEYSNTGAPPKTLDDEYTIWVNQNNKNQKPLHLITAGRTDNPDYWKNLAAIDWKEMFYSEQGQGYNLMLHLKALIESEIKPDYLLIDSRTGVTETSGITLSVLPDRVVIVAANNAENIYGSKMIIKGLKGDKSGENLPVHFVLSRVPFTKEPNDRLKEKDRVDALMVEFIADKIEIVGNINLLHSDRGLEENEKFKILEYNNEEPINIGDDYRKLFKQLFENDFEDIEKVKFQNQEKAQEKYAEFLKEKDDSQKFELINECISLFPESEYYFQRALVNQRRGLFAEVKEDYQAAIKLNPHEFLYYLNYFFFLFDNELYLDTLPLLNQAIEFNPTIGSLYLLRSWSWGKLHNEVNEEQDLLKSVLLSSSYLSYQELAKFYFRYKRYKDAYINISKALDMDPDRAEGVLLFAKLQYAFTKDENSFYLNLDRALAKGEISIESDEFFRPLLNDERFQRILYKYNITMKLPETPPQEEPKSK